MPTKKDTWSLITASIESEIPEPDFKIWFSQASLKALESDVAIIQVPNKFVANWLKDNYVTHIQKAIRKRLNFLPEIRFIYDMYSANEGIIPPKDTQKTDAEYNAQINPLWKFDNFVKANSNRLAHSSALAVAKDPGNQYNPLYIFCKLSLGKTHLLNAIGNYVLNDSPLKKVKYFSMHQFTSDLKLSLRGGKLSEFREKVKDLDMILMDDIHLLTGRDRSQEELSVLLNFFYEANKQMVFAGKAPPGQIHSLISKLRSRLEWGLLTEIEPPDQETKIKIIRTRVDEDKIHMPDDVAFFLANATDDLNTLMKYVISLETYVSLYQREIDLSTTKWIIKNKSSKTVSIRDIQKITAEYFNISLSDLISNRKGKKFSYPRQLAMYLARNLTNLSFKEIGKLFGNKDHSTIIYAVTRIEKEKASKKEILDDINRIQDFLI